MNEKKINGSLKFVKIIEGQLTLAEKLLDNIEQKILSKDKINIGEIIRNVEQISFYLGNSIAHIGYIHTKETREELKLKYDMVQRTMNNFIFNINSYLGE